MITRHLKTFARRTLKRHGYLIFPSHTVAMDIAHLRVFHYLSRMYERIADVHGTVVECGVGTGQTFLHLSCLAFEENKKRVVWGFNSFSGFPEPAPEDASERNPRKGEWSGTSPDDIKAILYRAGISREQVQDRTRLVEGLFDATLRHYDASPIALLHIDVDLYRSYRDVLQTLFPYVVSNGLVLFDEYGETKWPGATQAIDEFARQHGYVIQRDERMGKYYIVKR